MPKAGKSALGAHRSNYLVTCEHASSHVPASLRALFRSTSDRRLLETHAGYDIGALLIAQAIAKELGAPLFLGKMTRLLIDLNRSLHHPKLFSVQSRQLSAQERDRLLEAYHAYRAPIEAWIDSSQHAVVHLSVHSFTPVWHGRERRTDIGILYDPRRDAEARFSAELQRQLRLHSDLAIHRNLPYRGASDGFTTALRTRFSARRYLGIELEFNQRLVSSTAGQLKLARLVLENLARTTTT